MSRWRELLHRLYTSDLRDRSLVVRALRGLFRFLVELWGQFNNDTVIVRASGMAYTTLLAIVPLVAVFFSVFSTFKQFAQYKETVQKWLFSQVVPARTDEITQYIEQFTSNTSALGLFSTAVLFITAILLFDNIEQNFNALWHVESSRSYTRRFMTFTSVLLWAPILIALSFYITLKIRTYLAANFLGGLVERSLFLLPWVISVLAFFLLLKVVPATRVKWRSAMLGGAFGGTIWEVAKWGFTKTIAGSIQYNAIYGSLAVIPIFLVWLYLTWIIVLLAVEVSYVHHHYRLLVLRRTFVRPSPRERIHSALRLFVAIARAFHRGRRPPTADDLFDTLSMPSEFIAEQLRMMVRIGLLRTTDLPRDRLGYLPGRSLSSTSLGEVATAVYRELPVAQSPAANASFYPEMSAALDRGEALAATSLAECDLLAILEKEEAADPSSPPQDQ